MDSSPSRPIHRWRFLVFSLLVFGLCPLLFFVDLTRNPYYTQIALLNIFLDLTWMYWLIQAVRQGEFTWYSTALDLPFAALIGVCFLSWGVSALRHPNLAVPIYSEGSKGIIFLLVNALLAYLTALRFHDRRVMKWTLIIVYLVTVVAAAYGVAQYFGYEPVWPHNLNPYGSRPVSTFGNPNFMSSYLVVVIPVMIVDYFFRITGFPRVYLLGVILVALAALVATLTRSSWAGLVAALVWIALQAKRENIRLPSRGWIAALIVGMALIIFCWPKANTGSYSETVVGRITEIKSIKSGAYAPVSQRFLIWLSAWEMVSQHPWLGQGWGCFELFYPFYQGPLLLENAFHTLRTHANNAHDEIMEYWSQTGSIGLGVMILFWTVFFLVSWTLSPRLPMPWRALHWGFVGGAAGMLVDNLLNVSVHFAVPAFMFWWWVGSSLALDPAAARPHPINLRPAERKVVAIVGTVVLGCFALRSFCMWMEEVNFFEGFKLSKAGVDLVGASRALEKAYGWHQLDVNNNYELANVYARLGAADKALWMYRRALDANSGYDEIFFNRATVLTQAGRLPEAAANYEFCLAINPLSHEAYNALAAIYMKNFAANSSKLETLYLQGVSVFPQDKDLWNNLGYVYAQRNDWEKAFPAYRRAIEIDPNFQTAQGNLRIAAGHLSAAHPPPAR